jgi:hypothetical protein
MNRTWTLPWREAAEMVAALLFAGTLDGCQDRRPTGSPGACASSQDCVQSHGAGWYCDQGPPPFCRPPEGPLAGPTPIPAVYGPPPRINQPPLDLEPFGPRPAYGVQPVRPPARPDGPRPQVRHPPVGPAPRLYGPLAVDECV